mmetsp:Transcript_41366/g.82821  ORF Transcript_41366/g.82821 Transcript_41366/m.82821 type:complete len:290 (+) Transcript_41366:530-1399(+)
MHDHESELLGLADQDRRLHAPFRGRRERHVRSLVLESLRLVLVGRAVARVHPQVFRVEVLIERKHPADGEGAAGPEQEGVVVVHALHLQRRLGLGLFEGDQVCDRLLCRVQPRVHLGLLRFLRLLGARDGRLKRRHQVVVGRSRRDRLVRTVVRDREKGKDLLRVDLDLEPLLPELVHGLPVDQRQLVGAGLRRAVDLHGKGGRAQATVDGGVVLVAAHVVRPVHLLARSVPVEVVERHVGLLRGGRDAAAIREVDRDLGAVRVALCRLVDGRQTAAVLSEPSRGAVAA